MAWTNEQKKAIDELRHTNAIVSAGAGSGKTAVLTERVFQIIKNKEARVDELLILTFTNAAAHEMKDRIIKRLRDEGLFALADQVEGSNVTTFDAYALSLVKKYNYYFDIAKNVSVIDDNILHVKENEILNNMFDELYEKKDEAFIKLIHTFCIKDDEPIKVFVKDILSNAEKCVNKDEYLLTANAFAYNEDFFNVVIEDLMQSIKQTILTKMNLLDHMNNTFTADAIRDSYQALLDIDNFDDFCACIATYKNVETRKAQFKLDEEDKKLKKIIDLDVNQYKLLCDKKRLHDFLFNPKYQESCVTLFALARELNHRLMNYKKSKNAYSFSDIANMALQIVQDKDINKELKEGIKFIMVDEYQDTSDIQETFISALSNNNVFMVGDTKQSIYGFRNTNCEIFQNKYENFKKGIGGEKVDLVQNFRSRKEVIDDINKMFSFIMSKKYGAVDYKIDHITIAGNKDYDKAGEALLSHQTEIYRYFNNEKETRKKNEEIEARIIAQDILDKIKVIKIFDKDNKSLREAEYRDFAILVDKRKHLNTFKKVFDEYKIPISIDKPSALISSKVGYVFSNALVLLQKLKDETYDNEFKHALIALMRSFVYQENDNSIYEVMTSENMLQTQVINDLLPIAKELDELTLSQIIRRVYHALDIYNKLVYIGDVENNESALDALIDASKTMEELNFSFLEFIAYLQTLRSEETDFDKEIKQNVEGVVLTYTMHHSKGLEYPIVYLPCLDNDFYKGGGAKSKFKISKKYGLLFPVVDESQKYINVLDYLNKEQDKESTISEKIRLFYVALTRAREKAIILLNDFNSKEIYDLSTIKTFHQLIDYYQTQGHTPISEKEKSVVDIDLDNAEENTNYHDNLVTFIAKNPIDSELVTSQKKASKSISLDVNASTLEYGSKLHYLLELTDFKTKDTSFIKDKKEKNLIDKVLTLDIFKDLTNTNIYKEYSFFDKDNDLNGVIDLLLINSDDIKIVDYKTKNIDDEAYVTQLKYYQNFIEKSFKKKAKIYLLSIINAELKEIN